MVAEPLFLVETQKSVYEPAVDSEIVRLKVSATGISPCIGTETQELVINVTGLPEITAFPADEVKACDILPYAISGTSTNNKESSVLWTTTGSGTFDNAASLNPTYTPHIGGCNHWFCRFNHDSHCCLLCRYS